MARLRCSFPSIIYVVTTITDAGPPSHLRELKGEGPQKSSGAEKTAKGSIARVTDEGRRVTLALDGGKELRLRITSETDIEGVADRTKLKEGQKVTALYEEPQGATAPLGYDVLELTVEP